MLTGLAVGIFLGDPPALPLALQILNPLIFRWHIQAISSSGFGLAFPLLSVSHVPQSGVYLLHCLLLSAQPCELTLLLCKAPPGAKGDSGKEKQFIGFPGQSRD